MLLYVEISLHSVAVPLTFERVKDVYQKGSLICIRLEDDDVYKFPLHNVFKILQRNTQEEDDEDEG